MFRFNNCQNVGLCALCHSHFHPPLLSPLPHASLFHLRRLVKCCTVRFYMIIVFSRLTSGKTGFGQNVIEAKFTSHCITPVAHNICLTPKWWFSVLALFPLYIIKSRWGIYGLELKDEEIFFPENFLPKDFSIYWMPLAQIKYYIVAV